MTRQVFLENGVTMGCLVDVAVRGSVDGCTFSCAALGPKPRSGSMARFTIRPARS